MIRARCGKRILTMAMTGVVTVAAASAARDLPALAANLFLGWTLVALAAVDIRAGLLPDALTLPLIAAGIVKGLFDLVDVADSLVGAAVGYIFLSVVAWCYVRFRGRQGLGGGDIKLFAAAGAWLGWPGLPEALLIASFSAISIVTATTLAGYRSRTTTEIPFGPFLAFGMLIARYWGPVGS